MRHPCRDAGAHAWPQQRANSLCNLYLYKAWHAPRKQCTGTENNATPRQTSVLHGACEAKGCDAAVVPATAVAAAAAVVAGCRAPLLAAEHHQLLLPLTRLLSARVLLLPPLLLRCRPGCCQRSRALPRESHAAGARAPHHQCPARCALTHRVARAGCRRPASRARCRP